jgi:hypothetical protein
MIRRRPAALLVGALLAVLAAAGPACRKKETRAAPSDSRTKTVLPTRLPKQIKGITPIPPPPTVPPPLGSKVAPHTSDRQPTLVPTDPG